MNLPKNRGVSLAATNPWTYATGYKDAATGYLKLGARYYNPTTGRFTQPDPAEICGSYTYAGDNPANYTDPTGRSIFGCVGSTILFGAAAGLALTGVGAPISVFAIGLAAEIGAGFIWADQCGFGV